MSPEDGVPSPRDRSRPDGDELLDDLDDLDAPADEPVARSPELLDESLLDDLDELASSSSIDGDTLDEFVVDPSVFEDIGSDLDDADPSDLDTPPDAPVVLPWATRARLPDLGLELPARLDPGRDDSVWFAPDHTGGRRAVTVALGGLRVTVTLTLAHAAEPSLLLGRDVLAGRVLVRP